MTMTLSLTKKNKKCHILKMSPEKTFIFNSHFRMFSATRGDFFVAKKRNFKKCIFN